MLLIFRFLKLKKVIYYDIKPENILYKYKRKYAREYIREDSKFFLLNFGLIKDLALKSAYSRSYSAKAFITLKMQNPKIGY